MTKYGILELGSTNTKAYKYENNNIEELGFKTIEFKSNYNKSHSIIQSDLYSLCDYINELFDENTEIHLYGTSIFRQLNQQEIDNFVHQVKEKNKIKSFSVISQEMENELTVFGALSNVTINDNICVFIGGGGSTEISICKNGEILEMVNSNIGVTNILKEFPNLKEDITNLTIDEVTDFIKENLNVPINRAKYMILAGGDYLLRYENAKYPYTENYLFKSEDHPYIISYNDNKNFEERYYNEISLEKLKLTTPDNPNWWNGTRAMCAFTNAVAISVGAEIIIPTRISMVRGIVDRLL